MSTKATNSMADQADQNFSVNEKLAPVDPQVKPRQPRAPRRSFNAAYKSRVLAAYNACSDAAARGALLRKEGLYHSRITAWRHQEAAGKIKPAKGQKNTARLDHLVRENEHLKKKMAQAEAIIEIQKKVSDLLGTHILSRESSETTS